ncbi:MAG: hypothetical protein K6C35_08595 [Eubacterium sp.]|nr:hypothetical protein [Eubacterium sp.]
MDEEKEKKKPFTNVFQKLKNILRRMSKKKRAEDEAARLAAEEEARKAEEEAKKAAEEEQKRIFEEQAQKKAKEQAEVAKLMAEAEAAKEAKAKRDAEAKAKKEKEEKERLAAVKAKNERKKAAAKKAEEARKVANGEVGTKADQEKDRKYQEEVKRRAEQAKRRAEQDAEEEAEESASIDPVTGEKIATEEGPELPIYLSKYLKLVKTGDDIRVAISSIQSHPETSKNLVILGHNGFGTVRVGEDLARSYFELGFVKSDKIAKIKAKQLNKIGLEKLQGLQGGCLIIENAGLVSPEKLVEVIKDSGADANDYVVVLTGEIDSLARFFEQNQEIVDEFVYLIDIHKIKERGMSIIAKGYVKEKGYKADKTVIDRFKGILGTMEVGNIDRFLEYIDNVMKKCDDRESSNGDTGKKVITAEDFK